ncbi:hypothetical protein B0T11DRAFT_280856 [Plectosphaerella cucumerina]|uniref:DUF7779 domain-containing protein n=1 Tax=Plectosphaerella cucumerina TaxID=40658 RepID=A0A8K0TI06_9PEZI|nr:hypothetical protein B0T11DRAFT_280856 [Plectosphaerella cucumerina]
MEATGEIRRIGLTLLHAADRPSPHANIVFIHGLGGHPQRTWEAQVDTVPSPNIKSPVRKGSFFNPRTWGHPSPPTMAAAAAAAAEPVSPESQMDQASEFDLPFRNHSISSASTRSASGFESKTAHKERVHWPRDLLPLDIPNANIFVYGYNADVFGTLAKTSSSGMTLTQIAQNMLMDFDRGLADDIPIILCAHSLGGILVKEVLWQSKTNVTESSRKVHGLTKCVIFFGTPHRGSRMAGWGEMATKLVKVLNQGSKNQVIKSLALNSEILDRIQNSFEKMIAVGDFFIHTFQEGRPIMKLGKVVEDYSSKLPGYPGLKWEVIDRDHRRMIQFEGRDDPGYRQACETLKGYMSRLTKEADADRKSIMSAYSALHRPSEVIFSVPYARNKEFVGREDTIEVIGKLLSGPSPSHTAVMYGLGGIGKTQVALEIAHRSEGIKSVIWIHAGSRDRLEKGFRDVLGRLDIQPDNSVEPMRVVETWLRDPKNGPWLMVVDNVDDFDVVFSKTDEEPTPHLLSCIPEVAHGSVLFITRWKAVAQKLTRRDHVHLGEMSDAQGVDLIRSYLGSDLDGGPETEEKARALLSELGHVPLAIAHAAAFMREYSTDIAEYLELYRKSTEDQDVLLAPTMDEMGIQDTNEAYSTDDYPVLKAWLVSFNHIKTDKRAGALAIDLLSVMSFLDGNDIPRHLLKDFRPKTLSAQYTVAFGTLKSFSMLQQSGSSDRTRFRMHRLVQLAMRRWLEEHELAEKYAQDALNLVSTNFPRNAVSEWQRCVELHPHAEYVLRLNAVPAPSPTRLQLLRNVASFQDLSGQYGGARSKWEELVELLTETVGAEDMQTLGARDSLAQTLFSMAKFDEAENLLKDVLEIMQASSCEEDVEVLKNESLRAEIIAQRGDHVEAEKQHRKIFEAREKVLGSRHPDTLKSAGRLMMELWELGRFEEAEDLAVKTLDLCKIVLGETHPDTLATGDTLGFILECRGKLLEAEELKNSILETRKSLYGPNHPSTADSEHDVGWVLHQLGRYDEAKPHYELALEKKRLLLGEDHWKTLTTKCNLPVFYCDQGDYELAEEYSRRIILDFKRTRSDMHPQTLDATGGLAVILRHRGKLEDAAKAARTSIDGRNTVIGEDHPWTQPPLCHWGYILTLQGEIERGEEVMRSALSKMEEGLGKNHGYVFTALLQLSKNLALQGGDAALSEAEALARRATAGREASLGPEHPYTFKAMWQVARVLEAKGTAKDEALSLLRGAQIGLVESLGADHPDAMRCTREMEERA